MKHFYTLILLFAWYLTFAQSKFDQYDYFVQFNGSQLSNKVNIDEVLNHPILTKYTSKKPDFDLRRYTSIMQLNQKITIHGNFLDSIPYYQVTIPIKNKDAARQYLTEKFAVRDSVKKAAIQDFAKYSVYTPGGAKKSFAWNENYLIVFELTKRLPAKFDNSQAYIDSAYTQASDVIVDVDEKEAQYEVPPPPQIVTDMPIAETENDTNEDYTYDGNPYEEYTLEQAEFDRKLAEQQSEIIKKLFENGFTAPNSTKINESADISSWVNYGGAISSLYSAYSVPMAMFGGYDKYLPMQQNFANFIKGINLDFYFDNDNARMEEIIEYSPEIANDISKISNRKINKNIYKYFPAEKPLGYMTYHINTKEMLQKFPSLTAELFQTPKFGKEDISIVTDLISTIVDEEATAQLFDGDLSAFLYDMKEVEIMTKKYDYDENFEEKITEEKVKKQIPLFSFIFTSTHSTFGDKLLQLGVRKKVLTQNGNSYTVVGTQDYGDIFIIKDKDVVVVANTTAYFSNGNGSFIKDTKKDLSRNSILAKMDIAKTVHTFGKNAKESDLTLLMKMTNQFSDFSMESPKKLTDNKFKFILRLNTKKSDKNIILQTLDLAEEMTSK